MTQSGTDIQKEFLSHFTEDDIIMVAPLNWGLGHASRCIPLIRMLRKKCKKVIIASDGVALELLKSEFPDLPFYPLSSYNIQYRYESIVLNILLSSFYIIRAVISERKTALKLAALNGATAILSDNRLGFRTSGVKNYYLTHQINILHPNSIISWLGSKCHQWFIRKFDLCFVPDYSDDRALCPALSHYGGIEKVYIGPLSRISMLNLPRIYDICVVLSGPEPQRSILEALLLDELNLLNQFRILLVRGTNTRITFPGIPTHIIVKDLLISAETEHILNSSGLLISRSGYSTIMDIIHLEIKAIFIPTPGQTEQAYLAEKCSESLKYGIINQNEIKKLGEVINYLI